MKRLLIVCLAALCLMVSAAAQDQEQIIDLSGKAAKASRGGNGGRLTGPSSSNRPQIVSDFLKASHGHDDVTARSLVLESENPTGNGPVHMRLRQEVAGLEVYGTYVKATVTQAGELVSVVENVAAVDNQLQPAQIDYRDALVTALERRYPGEPTNLPESSSGQNRVTFARGSRFYQDPVVARVIVPLKNGRMRVGYLVETWDVQNQLWHTIVSGNGKIVYEELRTAGDSYRVFVNDPIKTPQAIVAGPGAGNAQSPIGWVTSDTTIGNNVNAYLDRINDNLPDAINARPTSSTQDFLATADLSQAPTTTVNQNVAVTNLFFLNNKLHDKLYQHGFTEAAGNFQENNFGKGGAGSDSVNAEAQDGGGMNNANFGTPLDGGNPRMQMYLWNTANPQRDGDVDSDIVYHEYGHGLTWRMIGGMSGSFAGALGEGMSDTVALFMNGDDLVAEYSTNNNTRGIRRFRYTNYPNTYSDVTGASVHNDGEIYAATMWKLRELWLGSGRSMDSLWDNVINGMNFTPSGPAYEDMRDGILQAMQTQAEDCIVWKAFAQFGIGVGADGRTSPFGVTESFVEPAACTGSTNTAPNVTVTAPANNSSFQQGAPVTFTGTASDTEDGSLTASLSWSSNLQGNIGTGGSFTRSDLVVGTHTITASVTDSGGLPDSETRTITITSAPPPTITLTATGTKVRGVRTATLNWSGATGTNVDVHRNGAFAFATANDGNHVDNLGKGGGSVTYRICQTGSTTACSNTVTVVF